MITLPLAGLAEASHYCGEPAEGWPLAPSRGRIAVTCPHCYSVAGHVVAVRER